MVVDLARAEVADHEVRALEDLVHRRRLVHLPGDRHEVLDVERVGVETAVPADHVERVPGVGHPGADQAALRQRPLPAVLHEHVDVAAVGQERLDRVRAGRARSTARARAAGRTSTGSAWAARGGCSPRWRRASRARSGASCAWSRAAARRSRRCGRTARRTPSRRCRGPPRRRRTRRRPRCGRAARVRRRRRRRSGRRRCRAGAAVLDRVAAGAVVEEPVQPQVPRLQRVVGDHPEVGQLPDLAVHDGRGHPPVVEQRGVRGEALLAHQLLVAQRPALVAEGRVSPLRDVAHLAVVRHGPLRPVR